MKSKLQLLVPATAIALTISLAATFGQSGGPPKQPPPVNRAPNQPTPDVPNPPGYGDGAVPNPPGYNPYGAYATAYRNQSPPGPMIDPTTGLPIAPAPARREIDPSTGMLLESFWKADNWKDPEKKLAEVNWDGLPLSEVARILNNDFTNAFDVLLPVNWTPPTGAVESIWDWPSTLVTLQMRNVNASEIFAAMNLLFENNNTALRWELKVNGNRQIALLRVRDDLIPRGPSTPKRLQEVISVADLIAGPNSGGMSMEEIVSTLKDIWKMTNTGHGTIQFHSGAQVLIVNGTREDISLVIETLSALRKKVDLLRHSQTTPPDYPRVPVIPPYTPKSGAPGESR